MCTDNRAFSALNINIFNNILIALQLHLNTLIKSFYSGLSLYYQVFTHKPRLVE